MPIKKIFRANVAIAHCNNYLLQMVLSIIGIIAEPHSGGKPTGVALGLCHTLSLRPVPIPKLCIGDVAAFQIFDHASPICQTSTSRARGCIMQMGPFQIPSFLDAPRFRQIFGKNSRNICQKFADISAKVRLSLSLSSEIRQYF